jgi:hypothetical protein
LPSWRVKEQQGSINRSLDSRKEDAMKTAKLVTPAILLMTLALPPAAGAQWFGGSSFVPGSRISRDGNNRPCHVPAGPCFPGPSVAVHVGKPPRADKPAGLRLKVAPADATVYLDGKYVGVGKFDGSGAALPRVDKP